MLKHTTGELFLVWRMPSPAQSAPAGGDGTLLIGSDVRDVALLANTLVWFWFHQIFLPIGTS